MAGVADKLMAAFKGGLKRASEKFWTTDIARTGIAGLDLALGGGFGYGRLAEVYGGWSTGKTLLMYHALIQNQQTFGEKSKKPGVSILFETEGSFTPDFFTELGGNADTLLTYPVDTLEDIFDGIKLICDEMAKTIGAGDDTPAMIGWDSIAASGTKHLEEVGMNTRDMTFANLMSSGTKLITMKAKAAKLAIIATNQTREKIVMSHFAGGGGGGTTTPGGNAWPFHSSQRIALSLDGGEKTSMIMNADGNEELGRYVKGYVVKNKLASPFGRFYLPIYVKAGRQHPLFPSRITKKGVDFEEALYWMYKTGHYKFPGGEPVLSLSGSWLALSPKVGKSRKFYAKDWPEVLAEFPTLWNLPYLDQPTPPPPAPMVEVPNDPPTESTPTVIVATSPDLRTSDDTSQFAEEDPS